MKWIETSIAVEADAVELIETILQDSGISGWQVIDYNEMSAFLEDNPDKWDYIDECLFNDATDLATIRFYTEEGETGDATIESVRRALEGLISSTHDAKEGAVSITAKHADDEDWLHNWRKYYKRLEVGNNIVIAPAWENSDITCGDESNERRAVTGCIDGKRMNGGGGHKLVVRLDPGNAFGTGQHESTRLCIIALERFLKPGGKMLDLGCGSGILSVVGLMLGAAHCDAADINPDAQELSSRNAAINGIPPQRLNVHIGDAIKDKGLTRLLLSERYDCIVANIIADSIISLSSLISEARCLNPGGVFISSGIIKDRADEVVMSLSRAGFAIIETETMGDWVSVVAGFNHASATH